jgi:hypothetical protein
MGPEKFEAKTAPEETGAEREERAVVRDPIYIAVIGRGDWKRTRRPLLP